MCIEQILNVRGHVTFRVSELFKRNLFTVVLGDSHDCGCVTHQQWPMGWCVSGMPVSAPVGTIFESLYLDTDNILIHTA
jgi:hypothetical protein